MIDWHSHLEGILKGDAALFAAVHTTAGQGPGLLHVLLECGRVDVLATLNLIEESHSVLLKVILPGALRSRKWQRTAGHSTTQHGSALFVSHAVTARGTVCMALALAQWHGTTVRYAGLWVPGLSLKLPAGSRC